MMNLGQECRNYKIKDMQLLYSMTKTVVLDNFLNTKKRINICNHQPSQTFKGANEYDKHKIYYNKEKEKQINT